MIRCSWLLAALVLSGPGVSISIVSLSARADDVLVGERARHPLTALIGVPSAASRASGSEWNLSFLHGNAFMGGTSNTERLILDGETTELAFTGHHQLSHCLHASVRLPLIARNGGSFDAGIETWHDWFGFPNAGRNNAARDQLLFLYEQGERVMELNSASGGLGDISVWLKGATRCNQQASSRVVWRAGIKLPTGDEADWLGSGGTDVWVDVQSRVFTPRAWLAFASSIGAILPGRSENLPRSEGIALFGAAGLRWSVTPRLVAIATLDWHTPLYDSNLHELGSVAGQLTTGVRVALTSQSQLDVQITEDILVDTATDIALRIAVTAQVN